MCLFTNNFNNGGWKS